MGTVEKIIKKVNKKIRKPLVVEVVEKTPSNLLKNKIILVTGGGSGLGFYIAKKLYKEGSFVIITGRNEEKLKKAQEEIGNDRVVYKVFDVKDVIKMDSFIDDLFLEYGKIDCIVNNAGISLHERSFEDVSIDDFDSQINTNLRGSYFLTQAFIKKYKKNKMKSASIIFISSERSKQCDVLPYGLTKVAINSLTEGLSRKYYQDGIRVNAVAPGITASDMTGINKNDDLYCDYNASERYFVPEEVAETVCYLISDYSKCISGDVIFCDAGNHLNPWFK